MTISTASTHTAPQIRVDAEDRSSLIITTAHPKDGYCTARTTHGIDGQVGQRWYFEVEIVNGYVRVGLSQILAEVQAPVGFDEYGYALRAHDGMAMHCGVAAACTDPSGPGDRIGVMLYLPQGTVLEGPEIFSDPTVLRDQESHHLRAQHEASYPPRRLGSYKVRQELWEQHADEAIGIITFFRNRIPCAQQPFARMVYRGKYYPSVSVYAGAKVRLILEPDWLPPGVLPVSKIV